VHWLEFVGAVVQWQAVQSASLKQVSRAAADVEPPDVDGDPPVPVIPPAAQTPPVDLTPPTAVEPLAPATIASRPVRPQLGRATETEATRNQPKQRIEVAFYAPVPRLPLLARNRISRKCAETGSQSAPGGTSGLTRRCAAI
jgi:hypothetical protein